MRHLPDGSVNVFDRGLRYVLAEGPGLAREGLEAAALVGRTLHEVFPARQVALVEPAYRRAFAGERASADLPMGDRTYRLDASPLGPLAADGRADRIVVVAREVTDDRRAERLRLARDLHDSVAQSLSAIEMTADVLPRLWELDPDEGRAALADLRRLAGAALGEIRALLADVWVDPLDGTPLGELLRRLAAAFAGRARVPAEVLVEGDGALPPRVQETLYRIAQEALNNAARHAGAAHVQLRLRWDGAGVGLEVADDGRGFDPGAVPAGHLGLAIMRERAAAIGAALRIASQPGGGTRVAVTWAPARATAGAGSGDGGPVQGDPA
jgi:signal transduction histidine kinase